CSFEFGASLIDPDRDGPDRGRADDDQVALAVVINVRGLEAQSGDTFGDVCGQPKLRTPRREIDADMVDVTAQPDCCRLGDLIAVEVRPELSAIGNARFGLMRKGV